MNRVDALLDDDMIGPFSRRTEPSPANAPVNAYDPPAVARSLLALTNRLSQRRPPATVTLGDAVVSFNPRGFGTLDGTVPLSDRIAFWLQLDGRPLILQMAKTLYERMIARIDPELLAAEVDKVLLPLLLESCLEDGFKAAETGLQGRLELMAIEAGAAFDQGGLDVLLDIAIDGDNAGIATLRVPRDDVERLAALFATRPASTRLYGDLKVELSFRAAAIWLDLGELRRLKIGDVLLADRAASHWDRMAATVGERWLLPLDLKREGPTLREPFRRAGPRDRDEWMMVDQKQAFDEESELPAPRQGADTGDDGKAEARPSPETGETGGSDQLDEQIAEIDAGPASPPADAAFDELPIKLVFELGRAEMALGDLQDIGPGHVFRLERPLAEAVEIHAGNRRIGRGEVVRIDEQVGVRIVRLFGRSQG